MPIETNKSTGVAENRAKYLWQKSRVMEGLSIINTTDIDMALASETVESGKHGLVIISCAGKYNKITKQYER